MFDATLYAPVCNIPFTFRSPSPVILKMQQTDNQLSNSHIDEILPNKCPPEPPAILTHPGAPRALPHLPRAASSASLTIFSHAKTHQHTQVILDQPPHHALATLVRGRRPWRLAVEGAPASAGPAEAGAIVQRPPNVGLIRLPGAVRAAGPFPHHSSVPHGGTRLGMGCLVKHGRL